MITNTTSQKLSFFSRAKPTKYKEKHFWCVFNDKIVLTMLLYHP